VQENSVPVPADPQFLRMYASFLLMTKEERDHQEDSFAEIAKGRSIKSAPSLKLVVSCKTV
jgi:hypothetical protein